MALIEINREPSQRELRFFGILFPIFFAVIGALVLYLMDALHIAQIIWGVATALTLLFALIKPLRLPMYLGWVYLAFPIGWTVSHLLMLVTYYLVLTPFALALKLSGRDPLRRRFDRAQSSYFIEHPSVETSRYFKQF